MLRIPTFQLTNHTPIIQVQTGNKHVRTVGTLSSDSGHNIKYRILHTGSSERRPTAIIGHREGVSLINIESRNKELVTIQFGRHLFSYIEVPFWWSFSLPYFINIMRPLVRFICTKEKICINPYMNDLLISDSSAADLAHDPYKLYCLLWNCESLGKSRRDIGKALNESSTSGYWYI